MTYNEPAPKNFRWPGDATLALSIVVNVEEGAERSILKGDKGPEPVDELGAVPRKPIRVHGNESNYLYGIKRGAPRVLKILDDAGIPATWTVCAEATEKAPWLGKAIAKRGDEPCSHGYRWLFTAFMGEDEERSFIRKGTDSIQQTCGGRPVGYLSRYLHTDITRRLLVEENYLYHMDDYSDDFPYWDKVDMGDGTTKPMIILPYAIDSNDMKFWLAPSFTPDMWLDYAKRTLDSLLQESQDQGARMMSLGLHLRIIGRPGRIGALKDFVDYAKSKEGIWITTRKNIARHFAEHVSPND